MASLRNQRRRGCSNKRQHPDKMAALNAIGGSERGPGLPSCRCQFCKHWHLGHIPASAGQTISNRTGIAPVYTPWLKRAWS